jgi:hypothetical protein
MARSEANKRAVMVTAVAPASGCRPGRGRAAGAGQRAGGKRSGYRRLQLRDRQTGRRPGQRNERRLAIAFERDGQFTVPALYASGLAVMGVPAPSQESPRRLCVLLGPHTCALVQPRVAIARIELRAVWHAQYGEWENGRAHAAFCPRISARVLAFGAAPLRPSAFIVRVSVLLQARYSRLAWSLMAPSRRALASILDN